MSGPPDDQSQPTAGAAVDEAWPGDYPGTEEVPVVNWPVLWRERLRHRVRTSDHYRWWVLGTALTGNFAAGFTITILAVAITPIAEDLGTSKASLSWIITAPMLTLALATPLFGKLGDVYGHRRVYLIGFSAFAVVAGFTATAWSAASIIGFRALGALAGSATGPTSMALIMQAFPEEDRVKAMGWWSLVGAGAPVIGLVVGGPVVDAFGWRWIFIAQAPIAFVAVLVAAFVLHETPRKERQPIDIGGASLLGLATVAALVGLQRGGGESWTDPIALALLALFAPVLLTLFVRVERRVEHPLLPLDFFGRKNFTAALVAAGAVNFAYMGGFMLAPRLVQDVFAYTVATTAYAMLVRPLVFSVVAPAAGYLTVRVGERVTAVTGTACVVASMLLFSFGAREGVVGLVFAGLAVSGFGLGVASPSLSSSVANAVDAGSLGIASATYSMVSQIGVVAGIQVLTTIEASRSGASGFATAYMVGGVIGIIAVVGAAFVRSADRTVYPATQPATR